MTRSRISTPSQPIARQANMTRRSGMTLIELLIVIGVIGILISIGVVAYSVVGNGAKEKATRLALANCQGMLKEFEATGGGIKDVASPLPPVASGYWADAGSTVDAGGNYTFSYIANRPAKTVTPVFPATSVMTAFAVASAPADNLQWATGRIVARILSVPANKTMVQSLPSGDTKTLSVSNTPANGIPALTVSLDASTGGGTQTLPAINQGTIFLDAWRNPIIFVPGGGLADVQSYDPTTATKLSNPFTVKSPDGRPFWVSAGPDGNIRTNSDNIYSFEVH